MLASRGEKAIAALISDLLGADMQILTSARTIPNTTELDIVVPKHKVAIEFNGLYWHTERTGRGKSFHLRKTQACADAGFRLIHVWEDDWKFRRSGVERLIRTAFGVFDGPSTADCATAEVDQAAVATLFAENCHARCDDRATFFDALMHHGAPVAAVSSRIFNEQLHVTQFASAGVDGAAAALSRALINRARRHEIERIRWVIDNATEDGQELSAAGFIRIQELAPQPWYARRGERMRSTSDRLLRSKLNGLDRIWDAGRTVWELSAG